MNESILTFRSRIQRLGFLLAFCMVFIGSMLSPRQVLGTVTTTISPYIVGATDSDFTTIQGAIDAAVTAGVSASNPMNIYIKPGTYAENLTLADGISLIGFDASPQVQLDTGNAALFAGTNTSVRLNGSLSYDGSSSTVDSYFKVFNLWISPDTGNAVAVTGSVLSASAAYFVGCRVEVQASQATVFTLSSCTVYFNDSNACDFTDGNDAVLFAIAGDGNYVFFNAQSSDIACSNLTPYVLPSNSNFSFSLKDSFLQTFCDASNAVTYDFIATNTNHSGAFISNDLHLVGTSTLGGVFYYNCEVTANEGQNLVTATSNNAFEVSLSNCTLSQNGSPSSVSVTGGQVTIANTLVQPTVGNFYEMSQLISLGFAGSGAFKGQAGLHTTDSATQVLASVIVNEGETVTLKGTITAAQSDHSNATGGDFLVTVRRTVSGDVTLVGSVIKNVNSSSSATFDCDADVGSESVRVLVTGVDATDYNWVTDYQFQKVLLDS
jgi:hypothetical protein